MDEQTQADDGRAAPPVPQRPRDELGRALLKRALAEIYTPRAAPVVFDGKRKELYPFTPRDDWRRCPNLSGIRGIPWQ